MPGEEPGKTLLDETLIVASSEFGRTPAMTSNSSADARPSPSSSSEPSPSGEISS